MIYHVKNTATPSSARKMLFPDVITTQPGERVQNRKHLQKPLPYCHAYFVSADTLKLKFIYNDSQRFSNPISSEAPLYHRTTVNNKEIKTYCYPDIWCYQIHTEAYPEEDHFYLLPNECDVLEHPQVVWKHQNNWLQPNNKMKC